ncbi:MAG: hypothetical protein H0T46_15335 [Deltaproteobacteria bacterium]|nr:hypothetical protein [Deltaproteobacteria bacterium]
MRIEEKEIDGLEIELAERQRETSLGEEREATARTEGELPEFAGEQARDMERERGTRLIDAMRQLLAGEELAISQLGLPAREAKALEALKAAVTGRNETDMFVYAEDRRSLLEQALAVLQPNLTSGKESELAEMAQSMEQLTRAVGSFREALGSLGDAQEELIGEEKKAFELAATPGDKDDKPKPKPSDPDAPVGLAATTLTGPERPPPAKPPTTLVGPEVKAAPKPASTLSTGPEVKPEAKGPTTLGDEKEIAEEAKKKPWWRRPLG